MQRIVHLILFTLFVIAIDFSATGKDKTRIVPGAESTEEYFPLLKGKKIAIVANHTAILGHQHLVDSLKKSGFKIKCVFAPEHGFRGESGNGDKVSGGKDPKTGITIISLYGIFQSFGIDFMQDSNFSGLPVIAGMYNQNFLGSYLVILLPVTTFIFLLDGKTKYLGSFETEEKAKNYIDNFNL